MTFSSSDLDSEQHPTSRRGYREPLPVRFAAIVAGAGTTIAWFGALVLLDLPASWLTASLVASAVLACIVCWILLHKGDRGVAAGIAVVVGCVVAILTRVAANVWLGW